MPTQSLTYRDLRNAILFAAFLVLLILFVRSVVNVLLTLSIAALLVIALSPVVTWLNGKGIPRWAGTIILLVAILGLIGGLAYLLAPAAAKQFSQFVQSVPRFAVRIQSYLTELSAHVPWAGGRTPRIDAQTIAGIARPFAGGLAQITVSAFSVAAALIIVVVTSIYALVNPKPLVDGVLDSVHPDQRARVAAAGQRVAIQISAWARGTAFAVFAIFLLTWIALSLLGFEQALLFAVIAGILELIPIIGPILSAVPPAAVALVDDPVRVLWVIGVFVVIQQVENHLLIPLVMSRQVRLHPVTVIFWVLTMGALFGIVGIFIATPTGVVAGVLYDELYLCQFRDRCGETREDREEQQKHIEEAKETGVEEGRRREQAEREHEQ